MHPVVALVTAGVESGCHRRQGAAFSAGQLLCRHSRIRLARLACLVYKIRSQTPPGVGPVKAVLLDRAVIGSLTPWPVIS
jgi:hypothetical protein